MTTLEYDSATDPTPPGASSKVEWSGFPWWLVGIGLVIAFPFYKVLTDPTWEEGFLFIKDGLVLTINVTVVGFVIAMVVGLIVSLGRLSKNTVLSNLAIFYIELIRGIPVIVTIFIVAFVVWDAIMNLFNVSPQSFIASNTVAATVAVGLIYAAFIAEVFRAGIQSVSTGQREAGMAMGLNRRQVFRLIVWPQPVERLLKAFGIRRCNALCLVCA